MKAKLGDTVYRIFRNYPYNVIKGKVIAIYTIKYLRNKKEIVYNCDIEWEGLGEEKQVSDKLFSLNPIEEIDKYLSEMKSDVKNYGKRIEHCNYTIDKLREERKKYKNNKDVKISDMDKACIMASKIASKIEKAQDEYDAVGAGFGRSVDADGNVSDDTGFVRACDAYGNLL